MESAYVRAMESLDRRWTLGSTTCESMQQRGASADAGAVGQLAELAKLAKYINRFWQESGVRDDWVRSTRGSQ